MTDRLTVTLGGYREESLEDLIAIVMANVEDGIRIAGAQPEKDYTMRDLIEWSMPLVHSLLEGDDGLGDSLKKEWHKDDSAKLGE